MGLFGIERSISFTPEVLKQLPNAVVLAGIECSGKTSFYKNLLAPMGYSLLSFDDEFEKMIRDKNKLVKLLSLPQKTGRIPRNRKEFQDFVCLRVIEECAVRTAKMITQEQKKIVLDGTNNNVYTRKLLISELRESGVDKIACVWMNTPLEECIRRFKLRGSGYDTRMLTEDIIRKHAAQFSPPTPREGFSLVIRIPFKSTS